MTPLRSSTVRDQSAGAQVSGQLARAQRVPLAGPMAVVGVVETHPADGRGANADRGNPRGRRLQVACGPALAGPSRVTPETE